MIPKDDLCQLIPHAGSMCLLDAVEYWDDDKIICSSKTHLLADNPLRRFGQLSIVHGIEYGAQAMAIHGRLLVQHKTGPVQPAYLASLKDVRFANIPVLDSDKSGVLCIKAVKVYAEGGNMVYQFSVTCEELELLSGQAMVIQVEESE